MLMVVCHSLAVVFQYEQTRSRDYARLPHAATEHLAHSPRLRNKNFCPGQNTSHWSAKSL